MTEQRGDLDNAWERAGFASKETWLEMEAFLKELEARGPAKSTAQRREDSARYMEISQRCNAIALRTFERAKNGEPAPHLTVVRPLVK